MNEVGELSLEKARKLFDSGDFSAYEVGTTKGLRQISKQAFAMNCTLALWVNCGCNLCHPCQTHKKRFAFANLFLNWRPHRDCARDLVLLCKIRTVSALATLGSFCECKKPPSQAVASRHLRRRTQGFSSPWNTKCIQSAIFRKFVASLRKRSFSIYCMLGL